MNTVKDFFKKIRVDAILRAVLLLVMAIICFVRPETAMASAVVVFSIFILCDGIISLSVYFFTAGMSGFLGTTLLGSVFKILLGILFLSMPEVSAAMFGLLFAIYLIATSCNAVEESLYLKRIGARWIVPFVLALCSLVGGVIMLFMSPSAMVKAMGIISGITLCVACIEDVLLIIDMYKAKKVVEAKVIEI